MHCTALLVPTWACMDNARPGRPGRPENQVLAASSSFDPPPPFRQSLRCSHDLAAPAGKAAGLRGRLRGSGGPVRLHQGAGRIQGGRQAAARPVLQAPVSGSGGSGGGGGARHTPLCFVCWSASCVCLALPKLQKSVVDATEEASSQLPGYVPPQRVAAPKVGAGAGPAGHPAAVVRAGGVQAAALAAAQPDACKHCHSWVNDSPPSLCCRRCMRRRRGWGRRAVRGRCGDGTRCACYATLPAMAAALIHRSLLSVCMASAAAGASCSSCSAPAGGACNSRHLPDHPCAPLVQGVDAVFKPVVTALGSRGL